MEECQKMRVLPCGKPAAFPRNPQVFPATSPQPVEKSVEFFAKLWKKPRLSRFFQGFSGLKSVFDVVDKSRLVVFWFFVGWGKVVGENSQKNAEKYNKRAGRPALFMERFK